MKRFYALALLIFMLCSCGKKYIVFFQKEGTQPFPTMGGGLPEEKTIRASNDRAAYKKAVEMIINLEKENSNSDFAYSEVNIYYAKTKSSVPLREDEIEHIRNAAGFVYLKERLAEKKAKNASEYMRKNNIQLPDFTK